MPISTLRQNIIYDNNIFSVFQNESVFNINGEVNLITTKTKKKKEKKYKTICPIDTVQKFTPETISRTGVNNSMNEKHNLGDISPNNDKERNVFPHRFSSQYTSENTVNARNVQIIPSEMEVAPHPQNN